MDDLTPHLAALVVYATDNVGSAGAVDVVNGALWAFSRVSGESVESLRSRMFGPVVVRGPKGQAEGIRYYTPPVGGVALIVTREAESLAVDPNTPVAEANPRSFSAVAERGERDGDPSCAPITDEDREYLASLPQPTEAEIAAQVAAAKASMTTARRHHS